MKSRGQRDKNPKRERERDGEVGRSRVIERKTKEKDKKKKEETEGTNILEFPFTRRMKKDFSPKPEKYFPGICFKQE